MVIADLAATADDNVLTQESSDTAFRKEQLRRLQDEVIELEDVRTGVSITDLGLNDFRMDLLGYMKEYGDLAAAPKGLHAVVPADPSRGCSPACIFALRNINADEHLNRGNRLHPHYLVYLDDEGNVIADHTEVKHLLDLIRAGCRGLDEPVADVAASSTRPPTRAPKWASYSELLTEAIRSMIDVTEERDVDSLFSPGQTTALVQTIAGLDDFELIAFLAIVEAADGCRCSDGSGPLPLAAVRTRSAASVPKTKFYEHGNVRTAAAREVRRTTSTASPGPTSSPTTPSACAAGRRSRDPGLHRRDQGADVSDDVLTAIDKAVHFPIIFEIASRRPGAHRSPPTSTARQDPDDRRLLHHRLAARRRPAPPTPHRTRPAGLYAAILNACSRGDACRGDSVGGDRQTGPCPKDRARDRRAGEASCAPNHN